MRDFVEAKKTPQPNKGAGQRIGWLRPTKGALSDTCSHSLQMQSCAARSKLEGSKFEASKWRS